MKNWVVSNLVRKLHVPYIKNLVPSLLRDHSYQKPRFFDDDEKAESGDGRPSASRPVYSAPSCSFVRGDVVVGLLDPSNQGIPGSLQICITFVDESRPQHFFT